MNSFEYELNRLYRGVYSSARDLAYANKLDRLPLLLGTCKNETIRLLHARGFDTGARDGFEPPVPYPEPAPRPTTGLTPEELERVANEVQRVLSEMGYNKTKAHSAATEITHQVFKGLFK